MLVLDRFAVASIRAVVDRVLAVAAEPRWLSSDDRATLLRAAGIELATSERIAAGEAAATAAERIGYPLVAKLLSPDILHKSDVGGVILGLNSRGMEVAVAALPSHGACASRAAPASRACSCSARCAAAAKPSSASPPIRPSARSLYAASAAFSSNSSETCRSG